MPAKPCTFWRHQVAKDLLKWLEDTKYPEEAFFSSLIRVHLLDKGEVKQVEVLLLYHHSIHACRSCNLHFVLVFVLVCLGCF